METETSLERIEESSLDLRKKGWRGIAANISGLPEERDCEQRLQFACQMLEIFEANVDFILLMSDKADFHLSEMMNH